MSLTQSDWALVAITGIGVLIIPALVLMVRAAIKWTKTESALENVVEDFKELVKNESKVHGEILETVRQNREASDNQMDSLDKRLRFMEEYWMKRGIGNNHS